MNNYDDIVILIPAYNPTEDLIPLCKKLIDATFKVLVVNDGSNDDTLHILKKLDKQVKIIEHDVNMGKGQALKTGFEYIIKNIECTGVVTADADGQHIIEDITNVANDLKKYIDTIILGSRLDTSSMPFGSKFGNSITRKIFSIATGKKIFDTQTGLRGIPFSLLQLCLNIEGQRYEYEINQLLYWTQNDIDIKEIKIHTIYINDNKASSFKWFKDSVKIYKCIFKNSNLRTIFLYIATSILALIIDFALLLLFKKGTETLFNKHISLLISVICARIISSICSFVFNRKIVFKSKSNVFISVFEYYALVCISMITNYLFLDLLTNMLNFSLTPSKIFVDLMLFIINYSIQKFYIFKKN